MFEDLKIMHVRRSGYYMELIFWNDTTGFGSGNGLLLSLKI
jgi:hypothetical protein